MGNGVVQALKKEFDIVDEWASFEIHPETPAEGVSMESRFPSATREAMMERLNEMGAPYGITFAKQERLSNSRLALEASEFAREQGKFHLFHDAVFHAYFTEGKDIGDREVLMSIGESLGLSRESLKEALTDHRYEEALNKAQDEGAQFGVSGTPTCIINGRYKVVGAQPIEAFRQMLRKIEKEGSAS